MRHGDPAKVAGESCAWSALRLSATVESFGHLDVLVNNAGSLQAGFFEEMAPEAFRSQVETNLLGRSM